MASLSASSPPHVSDDEDEFSMETFRNVGITMMVPPMINDVHRLMCETDTNLADFLCGIGGVLPVDPVRGCGPDGETYIYDRGALIEWSKRPENQIAETKEEKEEEGGVLDDEGKKLKEQKRKFIGPRGVPICLDDFKHDPEIKAGIEKIIDDYVSKMNNKNVDEATEVCRETSWQPYGKQLPGSKRQSFLKMSQKEQIDSIGTTDLSIALSKAYRELDEYREIMSEVLEDWKCPCMVVIGEEGHGKSSLMEQLFMLPIFARGGNDDEEGTCCTSMAIHCRLRRTPGESSITLSVRDINHPEVHLEGHTCVIPLTNAYDKVEKKMKECVALFDTNGSGIVPDKILVLEVHHPQVATIDLIDLPGTCEMPDIKRVDIETIYEHQVAEDAKSGGLAMYLAVLTCTTTPTGSKTIKFLKDKNLLEKTFGVFTKFDIFHQGSYKKLEGWVTGKNSSGGDAYGYVELGGGWTVTTIKAPDHLDPEYYTVHSIERLNIQKAKEREYFQTHKFLESLGDAKPCGVASLVAKIEPAHDKLLHGDFKVFTVTKICKTLQVYDYDLKMLGNVGLSDEVEKNNMARAEVKRRLGLVLPDIGLKFRNEFLKGKMNQFLDLLTTRQGKVLKCEELKVDLDLLENEITILFLDSISDLPSLWIEEIKDILTKKIVEKKTDNVFNLGFAGMIGNFFPAQVSTKMGLFNAIQRTPVFQLCAYQDYTTRIIEQCVLLLEESVCLIRDHVLALIKRCFSLEVPDWLKLVHSEDYSSATVTLNLPNFSNAIASAFILHAASQSSLAESYLNVEVGGMNPQQLKECQDLEINIKKLKNARDGVIGALKIPADEVSEIESKVTW